MISDEQAMLCWHAARGLPVTLTSAQANALLWEIQQQGIEIQRLLEKIDALEDLEADYVWGTVGTP